MISDFSFVHPERVHLSWAALGLLLLLVWLELRGRDVLSRFLSQKMQARLAYAHSSGLRVMRLVLVATMLFGGVLALMQPQTRGKTETIVAGKDAADIIVVLDVSKSMLAEDAAPNRLGRAKAEISEMLNELSGHRVGLVPFAGRATVSCPLTPDYGFFRMILRDIGPHTVGRGGTRIGDAIRKAVSAFQPGAAAKLILLVTDGEDHDSYPLDAAKAAKKAGVSIVSIGFGSEDGSQISITDPKTGAKSLLSDRNGQAVVSRLDGETLRKLALETNGAYVPAGTAALDLDAIVTSHIQPMVLASSQTAVRVVQEEQYPWFVLLSLLSLVGVVGLGARRGRREVA